MLTVVTVAQVLRESRLASGLSIRELAAKAGVSPSTVWRIESERLDPTVGMYRLLLSRTGARSDSPAPPTREAAVSLALGRLTARALLDDPEPLLAAARQRVRTRLADEDLPLGSRRWYAEWERLLRMGLEAVVAALIDPTERGQELRQNLPFTGILSEEDRLAAIRRASGEHRASRSA